MPDTAAKLATALMVSVDLAESASHTTDFHLFVGPNKEVKNCYEK